MKRFGHQAAGSDVPERPDIPPQEQFIKQVKDDSRPADQVLIERKDSLQNEDRQSGDSAPLFVP